MTPVAEIIRGQGPLIVSMPHIGREIPAAISAILTSSARNTPDADYHIDALYDFLDRENVTIVKSTYSRYVVDVNRPRSGENLYPGRPASGPCPLTTFEGEAIYLAGHEPDEAEEGERLDVYWSAFHRVLQAEIDRVRAAHGFALLWDAHSIKARLPRLFEGKLIDFNFGTNSGLSCAPQFGERLCRIAEQAGYTAVLDGRFKGGFITRHYGKPTESVYAVQLELSWDTYLDDRTLELDPQLAPKVIPVLKALIAEVQRECLRLAQEGPSSK